jgi:hypothetical protein
MIRPALWLCAALVVASSAFAQNTMQAVRPIQVQPVQPAEPAATTQVVAPRAESAADPAQVVDQAALLEAQNKKLRETNVALRNENATLKQRLEELTSHGGSQVHAYCANPATSRSTAGDEADCAASGNTCEPVSGLCRTTCQSSDMCAGGYTCDTGAQRCVYTAGGVPNSDD